MGEYLHGIVSGSAELFRSLSSPDRPTRRMSRIFFLCAIGVIAVFAFSARRAIEAHRARHAAAERVAAQAKELEEATKSKKADPRLADRTVSMGVFTLELTVPVGSRRARGVYNMAEFEIIVQLDSAETRAWLEQNLVQARNQVTNSLTPVDRDTLLSRDGKRTLRRQLIKRLNQWMNERGKVEEIYVTDMVVS